MKNSKLTANWDFIVSKTVNFCRLILSPMPYDLPCPLRLSLTTPHSIRWRFFFLLMDTTRNILDLNEVQIKFRNINCRNPLKGSSSQMNLGNQNVNCEPHWMHAVGLVQQQFWQILTFPGMTDRSGLCCWDSAETFLMRKARSSSGGLRTTTW